MIASYLLNSSCMGYKISLLPNFGWSQDFWKQSRFFFAEFIQSSNGRIFHSDYFRTAQIIEACVAENTSSTKPIGEIQRRTGLTVGEIYVERSRESPGQPSNAETAKRLHNRRHPPGVIIMNEPLTWRAFSVMH